jgi:signal transduction histidine kinase
MKIRTRLTLRYTAISAFVFILLMCVIYLMTERNRSRDFYHDLNREAVTKAHLFLQNEVTPKTMQSIYNNNRAFLDEVEVAVYTTNFKMLYSDAVKNDIVKETPEMIAQVKKDKIIYFTVGKYQALAKLYKYNGAEYIVTAAAYDGYGIAEERALEEVLFIISVIGLSVLCGVGWLLSRSALKPVSEIVDEAESITAVELKRRLPVNNENDELGELSIAFNSMLDRLEKAFESQKMFVSNVSHELRTPMAALIAEMELTLMKKRSPEEYEQAIGNALEDSNRIVKLVQGLLDMAKTDYMPEQINKEPTRLDELILDARSIVLKANPQYDVEIVFEQEADDDSYITVNGNSYLLTTAFRNIIENNCKFSGDKSSLVRISFWEENAIIRFSDNGIGISKEDAQKIFEPFYRGSNKLYARGNGIGMALVKKVVDIHGGTIHVNSVQGEGTTFIISLPHI